MSSLALTWDGLAFSQTHDLSVKDTAPPAEGFEKLRLLLINDVLHHLWIFLQLWESFSLKRRKKTVVCKQVEVDSDGGQTGAGEF